MRTNPLKKVLLAVATALAFLTVMSSPAGADTLTITGNGTIAIGSNYLIDVPGDGEDVCSPALPDGAINLTTSGTNASGTWSATTPTPLKSIFTVTGSGNQYQVDLNIVTASGTYTTTGAPAGYTHALSSSSPNHIILQARFYRVNPPDCAKTDLRCTMNVRVVLQAGSGFNGTLPGATAGETAKLMAGSTGGGTNLTPVGACDSDLSSVANQAVQATLYFTA